MKTLRHLLVACISIVTLVMLPACVPTSAAQNTPTVIPLPTTTIVVVPTATPQPTRQATTAQPQSSSVALPPLFDGHLHYSSDVWSDYPVSKITNLLDQLGIQRALVSSTPNEGTVQLYQANPNRIFPELRPYRTRDDMGNWFASPQVYAMMTEELKRGIYRGIGEFHLYGDDAKSPGVKRIVDLAVEHNLPLHAHSDEAAIETLLTINPKVKVMWAHTGFTTSPARLTQMFEQHPNLWAELSYRSDIVQNGKLAPEWRALFLKFPDRFVYGSDTWVESRWADLPNLITTARGWLAELPSAIAEKIAWRNLQALYGK